MASSLSPTSITLASNASLTAPSNSTVDFTGAGGVGDVAITGVNDCIVSGEFNTGTTAGGHLTMIYGERNGGAALNSYLAMGNGINSFAGPVMPQSGRVVALCLSQTGGTAEGGYTLVVNNVATALTVSIVAGETKKTAFGNVSFAALDRVEMRLLTVVSAFASPKAAYFVIFD